MKLKPEKRPPDLFSKVRGSIKQVRKQGDPPEEDLENMDGFVCDLCLVSIKRAEISQCPFCGRWVCRGNCYSEEELCCRSCAGVIRLMRESVVLGELGSSQEPVKAAEEPRKKE
ncbi:MAG: hypothetical protein ACMUHU_07660 [Thermoplasmatota archaeon]